MISWPDPAACCFIPNDPRAPLFCRKDVFANGYCKEHYHLCHTKRIVRDPNWVPPKKGFVFVNMGVGEGG